MKTITRKNAIKLIKKNINNTCVISFTNNRDYVLEATMEDRDDLNEYPDGCVMNHYGTSGWVVSKKEFKEDLKQSGNKLIDAIVHHQGMVAGNIYLYDENPIETYVDPDTYSVDNMIYIYGTNDEILSWLPYLTAFVDKQLTAYCFIIQNDFNFRERYYREQQQYYNEKDARRAINNYFDIPDNGDENDIDNNVRYERYKRLIDNIKLIVKYYSDKFDANVDENTQWYQAIESVEVYLNQSK